MIIGHDVSHHQTGVDVSRLAGRFIIARTAQAKGGQYATTVDRMYATHKANARKGGKIFGTYLYLGSGISAASNAALHASIEPDRSIPVMVDWENGSGNVAFLRACVDELRRLGYTVNLTYAPQWYLNGAGGGGSLAGLPPLCSSKYASTTPGPIAAKYAQAPASYWNGYGGNSVSVLQFSSVGRDAAYPGNDLDCLAFQGSEAQLAALFSVGGGGSVGGGSTQPFNPEEDTMAELKASTSASVTLPVPATTDDIEAVIGIGWVPIEVSKVAFFGPAGETGVNQLWYAAARVDPGRPWHFDVPAGALTMEVNYSFANPTAPAREVTATAGFRKKN
jgi:hypothetical protein